MNENNPKVSILMPVHNCDKYLWEAIESIINQTYENIELIIVDDFSTDNSFEIAKSFTEKFDKIKLFKNHENLWVVKTRNKLFWLVSNDTKYICIMDSDDIALPHRIQKQVEFMEEHIDYSILWGHNIIIDENWEETWKRHYPATNAQVRKSIIMKSPISQPTVMIRKESLEKVWYFNETFERCQDYELRFRFFDQWYKIWNVQENLLKYRVFEWQWKSKHLKLTLKNTIKIQKKYLFTKKYFSVWNFIYFILENILLLLPKSFILWMFKKLEYTK